MAGQLATATSLLTRRNAVFAPRPPPLASPWYREAEMPLHTETADVQQSWYYTVVWCGVVWCGVVCSAVLWGFIFFLLFYFFIFIFFPIHALE